MGVKRLERLEHRRGRRYKRDEPISLIYFPLEPTFKTGPVIGPVSLSLIIVLDNLALVLISVQS